MSAPSPAFKKGARVGGYIIGRRIGIGGMGEVYTAEQVAMQRTVALKILQNELSSDKTYLERFFREVRTLAQIEHPNIVRAIEAGADGETYFFAMSFVDGSDLKRLLDEGRRFSEEEAIRICLDVAAALKYVWNKHRLLHRDIKPANIMLTPDREVKLMDLGISKKLQGEDAELTMAGMMVGSPQYISPEQARAEKGVDFRADMYSLGASLFHIVTGKTPYPGETGMTVVAHHLSSPVPDPREVLPGISSGCAELIMRMMAKDKEKRFSSWDDLIAEMQLVLDENAGNRKSAEPSPPGPHPAKKPAGRGLLVSNPLHLAIFAILFAIVLLGAYYVFRKSLAEAKEERAKQFFIKASNFYASNPEPEHFREAVANFELVRKAGVAKYQQLAKNEIDKINQRAVELKKNERVAKVQADLDGLKRKSYEFETGKKWNSAISLWEEYARKGQFAKELQKEISRALDYLKRKKAEENVE